MLKSMLINSREKNMETNQSSQIKNDESAQAGSGNGNQVQDSSQFPELNDLKK